MLVKFYHLSVLSGLGLVMSLLTSCSLFQRSDTDLSFAPQTQSPGPSVSQRPAPSQPRPYQGVPRLNQGSNLPSVPPSGARVSYSSVQTDQRVVAITFDDGPHPSHTPRLLKMLRDRNIKATFYVVGKNAKAYPHIIRQMVADGHEIGNHTWNHPSLTSISDEQIRRELKTTAAAIAEAANYTPRTMRPPYGAINARIKDLMYSEFGYPTIMWSVDPQDWRKPGASVVTSRIVNAAHPGAILLAHDIHGSTIDAMPATFDQLLAKGYRFVTVSQLMNLEKTGTPISAVSNPASAETPQY